MKEKILLCLCSGCIIFHYAISQDIESNSNRERNFAFEVKHIDEFFERFNNDRDGFFVEYLQANYPGVSWDRSSLVTNLFNRQKRNWDIKQLGEFLALITGSEKPVYLDFYRSNWYAEALCKFEYYGNVIEVVIILKIQQEANGGSKWMIVSASSGSISPARNPVKALVKNNPAKFLNSMSHATNFISLSTALNDKTNIHEYLDDNFLKSSASINFLNALLKNGLRYRSVKSVKYHFLQLDGWIFTVDRFQRSSVNSGWLISSFLKASDKDKEGYRGLLFRTTF